MKGNTSSHIFRRVIIVFSLLIGQGLLHAQNKPIIKTQRSFSYYQYVKKHSLTQELFFNKRGVLLEKKSYEMTNGKASLRRSFTYIGDTIIEQGFTSGLKAKPTFKKTTCDSLGFKIIETISYADNGKSFRKYVKEVYLPKGEKVVEPSIYWFNASSFSHNFVSGKESLIGSNEKEWNDKGELIGHKYWYTEFYSNNVKKASYKYLLNTESQKLELTEKVTFFSHGLISSRINYRNGKPFTYKYVNNDGITYSELSYWRNYNSYSIGAVIDTTFVLEGSNEKPKHRVQMQIQEKLDSTYVYFDTIKTEYFYKYDRKKRLTEVALKRNDSLKIIETFNRDRNNYITKKSFNINTGRLTSNYSFDDKGRLLGYETYDANGNAKSIVKNKYDPDGFSVIEYSEISFRPYSNDLRFRHIMRNDTLYRWKWERGYKQPFILTEYTEKFNPYEFEIDKGDYFLLHSYTCEIDYSKRYSKADYYYNADLTCTGSDYYTGGDSSKMILKSKLRCEFGDKRVEDAFKTPRYFARNWEPRYYKTNIERHFPPTLVTLSSRVDGEMLTTEVITLKTEYNFKEWTLKEYDESLRSLKLKDYIKTGYDTLSTSLDSFPDYFQLRSYHIEYNKDNKSIDTSYYNITTYNSEGLVIKDVSFYYNKENAISAIQGTTLLYEYDEFGSVISRKQLLNGEMKSSFKTEYEYY